MCPSFAVLHVSPLPRSPLSSLAPTDELSLPDSTTRDRQSTRRLGLRSTRCSCAILIPSLHIITHDQPQLTVDSQTDTVRPPLLDITPHLSTRFVAFMWSTAIVLSTAIGVPVCCVPSGVILNPILRLCLAWSISHIRWTGRSRIGRHNNSNDVIVSSCLICLSTNALAQLIQSCAMWIVDFLYCVDTALLISYSFDHLPLPFSNTFSFPHVSTLLECRRAYATAGGGDQSPHETASRSRVDSRHNHRGSR